MVWGFVAFFVIGALVIAWMCMQATEGYEDEWGFHRGQPKH